MKLLYYDLETTGLDPIRNTIHQLSMIIDIDGVEVDRMNVFIKPIKNSRIVSTHLENGIWKKDVAFGLKEISLSAIELSGLTLEQIEERGIDGIQAFKQMKKTLGNYCNKYDKNDKYFLIGFNNRKFDDNFLRQFFHDMHDDYYGSFFWPNTSDVSVLATEHLMLEREAMVDFKLSSVAAFLGIEVDESRLHDGLYDVELTKMIREFIIQQHA